MAIEVAQAYVTILPSMKGIREKMTSELGKAAKSAGKDAGKAIEDGVADGAKKGSSKAGESMAKGLKDAGAKAGKEGGTKAGEGVQQSFSKAVDGVSKDMQSKMGNALSKVGTTMRSVGAMAKDSFAQVGGAWKEMAGNFSEAFKGSNVGQAFTGVVKGARTAVTNIVGTFKGIGTTIGGALKNVGTKVGGVFASVKATAAGAFERIGGVVKSAAGGIASAFGGIGEKVGGALGSVASKAGSVFATIGKVGAAGAAAVVAGVGAIAKSSLEAYASYEQLSGGVQKLFGESAATVETYATNAYSTMGISANQYMEQATSFSASLISSLGGDTALAAETANRAMVSMADNTSIFGSSIEDVQNAYQGFAKQNYTMLDNLKLGYGGTQSEMQRLIADSAALTSEQEKLGVSVDSSSMSFDNIINAIAVMQEHMGIAGNAQKETLHTIEGSMNATKAAWTNLLAEFGKDDGDIQGAVDNLVTALFGDESGGGMVANVAERLGTIVSTVAEQLPGVIARVAPQVGETFVSIIDSATGGLGTQVVTALEPVSSAIANVFSGMQQWVASNSGVLSEIGGKLADIGGKIMSALGGAIEAVAPVVGNLASGLLPILSAGLDVLGTAFSNVCTFISGMADALSPLGELLAPLAETIGSVLVGALEGLANILGSLDIEGFCNGIKSGVEAVVGFVEDVIGAVTGFFDGVAKFINDPVGTIQGAVDDMMGTTSTASTKVQNNFSSMANGVTTSTNTMAGGVKTFNNTNINNKSATVKATGNVIDGGAKTKVDNTKTSINNLSGKSIEVKATGNVIDGGARSGIDGTISLLGRLTSKSVDIITNQITRIRTEKQARGAVIPRHADGFIATQPTLTDVGWIGEAGAEAVYSNGRSTGIFPLTNRKFTGPFASEISQQVLDGLGNGGGDVNVYLQYDASADAEEMARDVARSLRRMRLAGVM